MAVSITKRGGTPTITKRDGSPTITKRGVAEPGTQAFREQNSWVPQPVDDLQRIIMDSITRGFADKATGSVLGVDERGLTQASRDRTPDYIEAPVDIAASVATSPYKIGGTLAGAGWGGVEGALNAYGHQKDWVPDKQGMWDIGEGAVANAALGAGGAKLGEWGGKTFDAAANRKTDAELKRLAQELDDAALQADRRTVTGKDTVSRDARMKRAELAQAGGPDAWKKMLEGMDRPLTPEEKLFKKGDTRPTMPHKEKVLATKLANPQPPAKGNLFQRAARLAGSIAEGGGGVGRFFAGKGNIIAPGLKALGTVRDIDAQNWREMQKLILDPNGKVKTDPATIDALRNYLAKFAMQGGSETQRRLVK